MNKPIGPDHYRYYETVEPDGVKLICQEFVVVGETECCWYLLGKEWAWRLTDNDLQSQRIKRQRKRVLKDQSGRKKFYATRQAAMDSFIERKKSHIGHLKMAMALAELSLDAAKAAQATGVFPVEEVNCGHNDYTASLNFSGW